MAPENKVKLAAAYLRVSTDEQAEQGISLPAQKSRIQAYCAAQGWEIYDFYMDDGYSGKDLDRPAMREMIAAANKKKFDVVVVIKLDRMSRRQKDVLYLLEDVFEPHGVGFKSVSEPFDTTTPFGKAAIGMMAVFAQLERETIIERVREAKKEAARQGRFMGGPVPFGYTHNSVSKTVEIDEVEAGIIRSIFKEYLKGAKGIEQIADMLTNKGIPAPGYASFWHKSTLKAIIKNPFYAGFIKHGVKLHKGKHEAIISEDTWRQAQGIIVGRASYNPDAVSSLLTGIIYCAECGARMRAKKVWQNYHYKNKKIAYYVCYSQDGSAKTMVKDPNCRSGYKRADIIEDLVVHKLMKYSTNKKMMTDIAQELLQPENKDDLTRTLTQAQKELEGLKRKLNKWYDSFEKDAISADDLKERVKDLKERREFLEKEIRDTEQLLEAENDRTVSAQEILDILQNFKDIWEHANDSERRAILLGLIDKIYISKDDDIKIEFIANPE